MTIFRWTVIALLVLALLPMPYNFYFILRIAVTIYCAIEAYYAYERKKTALAVVFIVVVILYNPIIRMNFPKEIWTLLNAGFAATLFLARKKLKP